MLQRLVSIALLCLACFVFQSCEFESPPQETNFEYEDIPLDNIQITHLDYNDSVRLQGMNEFATCEGKCSGAAGRNKIVKGQCPQDCDQKLLDKLEKLARAAARKDAINQCGHQHENCICADGTYKILIRECKYFIEKEELGVKFDYCNHRVVVQYNGRCKNIP